MRQVMVGGKVARRLIDGQQRICVIPEA